MNDDPDFLDQAAIEFANLPIWLQDVVERHLRKLAQSPVDDDTMPLPSHGEKARRSWLEHGPIDGKIHYVSIIFFVGEDAKHLTVGVIAHQEEEEDTGYWEMH
jgi:hypothetical protein